jgi:hypothetical protein
MVRSTCIMWEKSRGNSYKQNRDTLFSRQTDRACFSCWRTMWARPIKADRWSEDMRSQSSLRLKRSIGAHLRAIICIARERNIMGRGPLQAEAIQRCTVYCFFFRFWKHFRRFQSGNHGFVCSVFRPVFLKVHFKMF